MKIIPAIDLMGGKVVRLYKGDPEKKTVYGDDPLAVAKKWEENGADMLHLVDLDATLGLGSNLSIIKKIVLGIEEVEVPAGKFDCWKIQWTYPEAEWNDDVDFYEYVSREGLIKREAEFRNINVMSESGTLYGKAEFQEKQYLTDYDIVE